MERRYCDLRQEGRKLSGIAMPYGQISPTFKEKFVPGSFRFAPDGVILNAMHDRRKPLARYPGGGLELVDTPEALSIRADLPETTDANDTLALVQRGILAGLSIEFDALEERTESGIRVVTKALLGGIGVVDRAAYSGTTVEARRRIGRIRATVPYKKRLDCRCKKDCDAVNFQPLSFADAINDADREILAIRSRYADSIGSKKAGTLRFTETDDGLQVTVDIPDTAAGTDLLKQADSVPLLARPVWDEATSQHTVKDGVSTVTKADIRAILIGPTDADQGWPKVLINGRLQTPKPRRQRFYL